MPFLPRLSRLLVAYNRLESLNGVQVKYATMLPFGRGEGGGDVATVRLCQICLDLKSHH